MNLKKITDDPHYTGIIYRIESIIHDHDCEAIASQITLKDTEVKSILQKVIGTAKGKNVTLPAKQEKEKRLKLMFSELTAIADTLSSNSDESPLSKSDWILALRVVDDSLKTRREMGGHSRGYLEFLKDFLEEGEVI